MRYFEFLQKVILVTVIQANRVTVSYIICGLVIRYALLLIRIANHSFSCRLLHATLSYVRFSAVVYKSFHDIGFENYNLISENASCSVVVSQITGLLCEGDEPSAEVRT
jgi:hypothetical protein